jgi:3-oxoacyl-[acyl-carrier protein] reductase
MDLGLNGRVALVMGASRGLGRAIAENLEREGARVAAASRSGPFVADTGDLERMAALPAEVEAELGPVEILVANTGGPPLGGAHEHDVEEWQAAYRSLVLAPRVLSEAVLPGMRERHWGRILNVGSTSTVEPIPGLNLSNAHRMAAVGFFKTLATEVAGDGITVNTVATGRFATERLADASGSLDGAEAAAREQVPAGRLGSPEEYGDLAAFLCSERAAYITGTVIPIDGGLLRSV